MRYYTLSLVALALSANALVAQTWQWMSPFSITYTNSSPQLCTFPIADNAGSGAITAGFHGDEYLYNGTIYGTIAVRSHTSSGDLNWEEIIEGNYSVCHLVSDEQGDIFIAGMRVTPGVDLSEQPIVIKLNASGQLQWMVEVNDLIEGIEKIRTIEVSSSGKLFIGCDDQVDSYVLQLDANGALVNSILQSGVASITSIVEDEQGNIYVAGGCAQTSAMFGNVQPNEGDGANVYIASYAASGEYQWSHVVNDNMCSESKLKLMPNGNILFSSHLRGIRTFGDITLSGPPTASNPDFFIACLNEQGEYLWARETPGNGRIEIAPRNPIAVDAANNVYFAGRIQGATYWENDLMTHSSGANDIIVLKFDSEGVLDKAWTAGGIYEDRADGLSVDENGAIYVSGVSTGNINFGGIQHSSPQGVYYPFVAQLADNTSAIEEVNGSRLQISPNPADDRILIHVEDAVSRFELYDLSGKLVHSATIYSAQQLDISMIPAGMYTVRLISGARQVRTAPLIIK